MGQERSLAPCRRAAVILLILCAACASAARAEVAPIVDFVPFLIRFRGTVRGAVASERALADTVDELQATD